MVAGNHRIRNDLAIIPSWLAADRDCRFAFQQLHFPDEHQRPELPFIYPDPGREVLDDKSSVPAGELGAKHIGIGNIVLTDPVILPGRPDKEMTSLFLIEQRTEQEAAVEPRHAHPLDIRQEVDIGQIGAVADDTHIIFVNRHVIPVYEQPPPFPPRLPPAAAAGVNSAAALRAAVTGSYIARLKRRY